MKQTMPHKYILVGASGTGKSTMASHLASALDLTRCITCTTRPPRPGEMEKGEYYFVQSFDMFTMFEQAEFGGYRYGITKDELTKGDLVILDPQGVDYYRKNYPGPLTVIKLERSGVDVDPQRRARDAGAGFDKVKADITVYGETVAQMQENLVTAMLSYEYRRQNETGVSYLPEFTSHNEVRGEVALYFEDAQYGLPVSARDSHRDYRVEPYGYDGIYCFEAANYDRILVAYCNMTDSKKPCMLDFRIEGEDQQTLYFARLFQEEGQITGELYPDYLQEEPYRFVAKTPADAVMLAYGGFLSAEMDCIGADHLYKTYSKPVQAFRDAVMKGRFDLYKGEKPSLDSKICAAAENSKYQMQKLFSPGKSISSQGLGL